MSLFRASPKLINRIMTGRVPSRAFIVGLAVDNATPGSPGVTNHIDGLKFRDQIDPATLSFSMPTGMGAVSESLPNGHAGPQPTVRCEIQTEHIHETSLSPLPGGQIFMNRYFEADFPVGTASITNYLVLNGWFSAAGALANASVPAALNVNLPTVEARSGSLTGR